jgi:hypothetical protein
MAREANLFVRDRDFNAELKRQLGEMMAEGSRRVASGDWNLRPPWYKAAIWVAYGIVRLAMGYLGYGGNEWFARGMKRPS